MISYLKGTVVGFQKSSSDRVTLILEVNQIGYELQIPPRLAQDLSPVGETAQVFTHLQVREDQISLYGFASAAERDLFRQLVSVSGIGAALAIALLDTLGLQDLVQAIVTGNIRALAKTRGVGNKTAERIALELKTKLAQWRLSAGVATATSSGPNPAIIEDVEMTLLALGYTSSEVVQALNAVSQDGLVAKSKEAEDWIRAAIAWLSR
ncbi:Holliday junction branch migration protein RuvA [Argonema antarcticum]|uniref:Holliday junction branch migration protein RuvA n=1 Tax=Argonema antarcticum TaxID=2942763 RepID=UPI0020111850|nr:Holliday junction branch migration protein RuvA [Argonema antarcticum]MCL1471225.1 Holliday junction branch migration protein RuvA [Argonema antarcticum A004/B2]